MTFDKDQIKWLRNCYKALHAGVMLLRRLGW